MITKKPEPTDEDRAKFLTFLDQCEQSLKDPDFVEGMRKVLASLAADIDAGTADVPAAMEDIAKAGDVPGALARLDAIFAKARGSVGRKQ